MKFKSIQKFILPIVAAVICQCGSSSNKNENPAATDGGSGAGEPLNPKDGELVLRVDKALVFKKLGSDNKKWAQTYVFLSVTLANGANSQKVPANPALFSIVNNLGLSKAASYNNGFRINYDDDYYDYTFIQDKACDPSISIEGGASLTCGISAVFDGDVEPAKLTYLTPGALALGNGTVIAAGTDTRTASSPISAQPCTDCESVCTNLQVDINNCGACKIEGGSHSICDSGTVQCTIDGETACQFKNQDYTYFFCENLATDLKNCGACGVEKASYEDNCGACNASCRKFANSKCTSGGRCALGQTAIAANKSSCNETCKSLGYDRCYQAINQNYMANCSDVASSAGSLTCECDATPISQ